MTKQEFKDCFDSHDFDKTYQGNYVDLECKKCGAFLYALHYEKLDMYKYRWWNETPGNRYAKVIEPASCDGVIMFKALE